MEYKFNSAIVRIHNEPNQERIKSATENFLKKVQANKNRSKKTGYERFENKG